MSDRRKTNKGIKAQRVRTFNETTILVNLDADPILPFAGAKVVANAKGGWVKIQLRDDYLYVDEKRLGFYLSEKQKSGTRLGYELKDELVAKAIPVLHPNILDALIDHSPHLIPEGLKADDPGNTRYTYWWAVIYGDADEGQYVRCCYFVDGAWRRFSDWLGREFDGQEPAARAS